MEKFIRFKFIALVLLVVALIVSPTRKALAQDPRVPTPDFSEMEKDYEIVKWTYESSGYIRLIIKPKTDGPHDAKYGFDFFDADGVKVDGPKIIFNYGFSTPAGQTEKGEAYAPDEATMRKVKAVVIYKVLSDGTEIGPKPHLTKDPQPPAKKSPPKAPGTAGNKPSKTPAGGKAAASAKAEDGCTFEKQPASSPKQSYSQALIKSLLYERYSFEAEIGGISSPAAIGVKFLNIKTLGSYKNTVTIVPGKGAQRKHDGAPVNALIYRFHAKYIVCRKYSDSIVRTQYESDNVCFRDKKGGWNCAVDSVPQITELKAK